MEKLQATIYFDTELDDYNVGCSGKTISTWTQHLTVGDSSEFFKEFGSLTGYDIAAEGWGIFEERLETSVLVGNDNCEATEAEKTAWEAGNLELYCLRIEVHFSLVETTELNENDIKTLFPTLQHNH